MKDTPQTVRRSSRHFFLGTLLSRISGMARDISMAYVFGTQPSIAAFMVAFRFAHLLRRVFGEGALQSAFIPEFESLRHRDEGRAFYFFHNLTRSLSLLLILLIGLGCGLLAAISWGLDLSTNTREVVHLTLLMLPSLLFICLFGLNSSLLQCEKSYFIPSAAPIAFNLIWIGTVFALRHLPAEEAMPWLSLGVVVACLAQWLLTLPATRRSLAQVPPFEPQTASWARSDLSSFLKPLALGLFGMAASQINNAVDALFARYAEAEGPAFLWYAIRLQQLPLALFGIAIAGALLPPLVRAKKAGRVEEYHHFLHDALHRTWLFMLPLTALLFLIGDMGVQFVYGRGDFGARSVIQTTYCLWAYGAGLLPSALILILAPVSYAQQNYRLPVIASFIALVLNLVLNTLFIMGWEWGAISVAVATSTSAWVNCLWLGWRLQEGDASLFSRALLHRALPQTLATFVTFLEVYQMRMHIPPLTFFSKSLLFSSNLEQCFLLTLQAALFGVLFLLNTALCRYSAKTLYPYRATARKVEVKGG